MRALTVVTALLSLTARAASPFDGTWVSKEDTAAVDKRPYNLSLAKGVWKSDGPVPPISVKADGFDQPVKGHDYFDTVSVLKSGEASVQVTSKKKGNVAIRSDFSVSEDGSTLTQRWSSETATTPRSGEVVYQRIGPAAAGAHPVSGAWRAVKLQNVSTTARTVSFQIAGDTVTMTTPAGTKYVARVDGRDVPLEGDKAGTTVSVKLPSPTTLVETSKRSGKVVEVDRLTVAADGKTMKLEWDDRQAKRKGSVTLEKAP